jgi:hypothetical protein
MEVRKILGVEVASIDKCLGKSIADGHLHYGRCRRHYVEYTILLLDNHAEVYVRCGGYVRGLRACDGDNGIAVALGILYDGAYLGSLTRVGECYDDILRSDDA